MSDLDFNKLINEDLVQGQIETAFRIRLKQQSIQAISKGHQKRLWYRRTSMIGVVLLAALSAFWSGRISMEPEPQESTVAAAIPQRQSGTILVTQDLVTWLETARFFKQLHMEKRANKAFQEASTLTRSMEPKESLANQELKTFPSPIHKKDTLGSLLAYCDTYIQQHQLEEDPKAIFVVHKKQVSILAQITGGKTHDR